MFVTILGNALDGFRVHGPFNTETLAHQWAADQAEPNWCVMPLYGKEESEQPKRMGTDAIVDVLRRHPGSSAKFIGEQLEIAVIYPYLAHAERIGKISKTGPSGSYRYYNVQGAVVFK